MAARNKSKKPAGSKAKKPGPSSRVKPTSKRASKATSSSSARNRVGKSKPGSNTRVARPVARKTVKTTRAKVKAAEAKLLKRKRKSSTAGAARHESGTAKRPVKGAARKAAPPKSLRKVTKDAGAADKASNMRAHLKEQEAKALPELRGAQES